jgi:hypothetical protein
MKRALRLIGFVAAGALLGLGYYYLFGCSGNCAVTARPWVTMGYVAVIGGLLGIATQKKEAA